MAFDPITGEPIEEQPTQETGAFDPMTGEPIGKKELPKQEAAGFDPMTGEPLGSLAAPQTQEAIGFDLMTGEPIGKKELPKQEAAGFDPMTGEPLGSLAAPQTQEAIGFDPMTGEPLGSSAAPQTQETMGFDPMTGEPLGSSAAPQTQEPTGFDPMTGESLGKQETPDQNTTGFDPMTGEPLGSSAALQTQETMPQQETMGFDPMTGEPIGKKELPKQEATGFDPMTGEPLGSSVAPQTQETTGFDPMTGKPIGQPVANTAQEAAGFDPMTGKPIGQPTASQTQARGTQQKPAGFDPMTGKPLKDKKSKLPVIIGGIAAVAAIIVLVFAVISSGLFSGKAGKVALAFANTFKDRPHFMKDLGTCGGILSSSKYTVGVSFSPEIYGYGDVKVKSEFRISNKEKQVWAQIDSSSLSEKVELLAGVNNSTVKCSVPAVSKYVFTYDYKAKNKGYLMDELSDDQIDEINTMLKYLSEGNKNYDKTVGEIIKVFAKEIKNIKFTNAEKEEYTINDKDVTCKGYKGIITSNNLIHIVDEIEQIVRTNYDDLFEMFDMDDEYLTDYFEEIKEDLDDFEDIEFVVYIYKNQIAAIIIEESDYYDKMELCFEGGDYRMQNIMFKSDDYRYQISGKDTGTKETFTFKERYGTNPWDTLTTMDYNYDSGKFDIDSEVANIGIEGKLIKSKSGLTIKIDKISEYGIAVSPNVEISITKGAQIEKYGDREFDIGNADEDDIEDVMADITDNLIEIGLYYLLSNYKLF